MGNDSIHNPFTMSTNPDRQLENSGSFQVQKAARSCFFPDCEFWVKMAALFQTLFCPPSHKNASQHDPEESPIQALREVLADVHLFSGSHIPASPEFPSIDVSLITSDKTLRPSH
jgi:hypothetical protein